MSSEDFKSLIVTDPDLVDPEIDISGLRTQTDTNPRVLGSIPDLLGIKYDPTSFDYLKDLNELFAFGLPMIETDEAQIPGVVDTLVDVGSGDGGQATTPITTPVTTPTTDGGITNIDTPLTQMVTNPFTGQTQTVRQAMTSDAAYTGTPSSPFLASEAAGGASLVRPTTATTTLPSGDVFATDDPMLEEKIDFQTPEQQEGYLQNVLGRAGQTVEGALNELGKLPGAIVDFGNQTVDVFGKKLNVAKTLASAAINKLVGGPISLVFDALGAILPEEDQADTTKRNIVDELKAEKDYGFNMTVGNLNVDPFGRSPVSAFGNY